MTFRVADARVNTTLEELVEAHLVRTSNRGRVWDDRTLQADLDRIGVSVSADDIAAVVDTLLFLGVLVEEP